MTRRTCSNACRQAVWRVSKRGLTLDEWVYAFNYYIDNYDEWQGLDLPAKLGLIYVARRRVTQSASGKLVVEEPVESS